jgi:DNA-binding CsgD family transcriptional regulator
MPGNRKSRIGLRDARDLYLLMGECRALGNDGAAWRRHLVTRLRKLLDADMSYFADNEFIGEPGAPQGWIRPLSIIDDWESDKFRPMFYQYLRRGRLEDNPMAVMYRERGPGIRVATRRDIVPDDAWYGSSFYRDYLTPAGYDDFVFGVIQAPERFLQMLFVQRFRDREPFPHRAAHVFKAVLIELDERQPHELHAVDDSAITNLPRRMLQVLACLLAGYTVKESAELLGVSAYTIQEHVKRLYKRSGTTNRAELADCYRDIAPLVMGMSLDEFPDHQQQVRAATRQPWPTVSVTVDGDSKGDADHS